MTAEIIEFPGCQHEDRLMSAVIGLEQIVSEIERVAIAQPADTLHRLLSAMEQIGDRLVESSSLLLDDEANDQIRAAFTSLSEKIAEAREALGEPGKPGHP